MTYVGIALIILNSLKIYSLTAVKWTLNSTELMTTSGILPWSKVQWRIPVADIYESIYSRNILGHFLGFGNITIRRTDGTATRIYETNLGGARDFSGRITQKVLDFKVGKGINHQTSEINAPFVSELKHLVDLKNKGELTQEEFLKLKERVINRS
jgi:hypothetical protein